MRDSSFRKGFRYWEEEERRLAQQPLSANVEEEEYEMDWSVDAVTDEDELDSFDADEEEEEEEEDK